MLYITQELDVSKNALDISHRTFEGTVVLIIIHQYSFIIFL